MKTPDLDAVTRGLNPSPAIDVSDAAWSELSAGITSSALDDTTRVTALAPRRTPNRPRLLLAAACTLLIAGVVAAAVVNRPDQDRTEALSVTAHGDKLIIRVVDPTRDPAEYNRELKRLGLNVKVLAVPVSAPNVGSMLGFSGRDEGDMDKLHWLEPGENCNGTLNASDPGCQGGLEIPKSYDGETKVEFGRVAAPGERLQATSNSIGEVGEPLHGVKFKGTTLAEMRKLLAARNLTVDNVKDDRLPLRAEPLRNPSEDWYVHDATQYVAGAVTVYIAPTK